MSHQENQGGFGLIEILVALGLFIIGILAVTTMFDQGQRAWAETDRRRAAVWWARDKMDTLLARSYDRLIEPMGDEHIDGDRLTGADQRDDLIRTWSVAKDAAIPQMLQAEVTVRWTHRGVPRSYQVWGWIADARTL